MIACSAWSNPITASRESFSYSAFAASWSAALMSLSTASMIVAGARLGWNERGGYPARLQPQLIAVQNHPQAVAKCLDDMEMEIARRLSWLAFSTRLGPMLGLVGTLVPLGPALTGLAAGDIQALSGNLVIAFTTTVFGVLVGGIAYAASLIRRAWHEQDLSDLEFVASQLNSAPR